MRFRRRRNVFVRQYSTSFTQTVGQGTSSTVDTGILLPENAMGPKPSMLAKSIIIQAIDWRTQFITTALPTSGHGLVVYEAIYRDQVGNAGSGIHTGQGFLGVNELGGSGSEAAVPKRILMRRMDLADEAVGVPDVSMNWHPLRIRNKCRLNMDEALFWRVELVNGSTAGGNWSVTFYALAAIAYSVTT